MENKELIPAENEEILEGVTGGTNEETKNLGDNNVNDETMLIIPIV